MPRKKLAALPRFLMRMAEDPAYVRKFKSAPLQTMSAAGLTDSQKHLVLAGNSTAIQKALKPALRRGDIVVVTVVVVFR